VLLLIVAATPFDLVANVIINEEIVMSLFLPPSRPQVSRTPQGVTPLPMPAPVHSTPTPAPAPPPEREAGAVPPNVFDQSSQALTQAVGATSRNLGFNPMAVGGAGYQAVQARPTGFTAAGLGSEGYDAAMTGRAPVLTADQVRGGQIGGADLSAYLNPYESQVVGQSLSDIERSRQMARTTGGAQASAARAFGGSRHGIADAETNRAYADQAARTASGLRQAGYDRATTLAGQDINTRMQSDLANQSANLQAGTTSAQLAQQRALQNQAATNQARQFGASAANVAGQQASQQLQAARQFGAGAMNQSELANQAAMNQARQFGASQSMQAQLANQAAQLGGAQHRMSAAAQLGNLSNLGFGQGQDIQKNMQQQGAQQQAIQQAVIDAAKGQFGNYADSPAQSLQYLLQAVGGSPQPSTTNTSKEAGLFDYLSLMLGAV